MYRFQLLSQTICLMFVILLLTGCGSIQAEPTASPTPQPTSTHTPTSTPTFTPTLNPTSTQTLTPTNTPTLTNTPVPPTDTPIPTDTPMPPTNTPVPTDTPLSEEEVKLFESNIGGGVNILLEEAGSQARVFSLSQGENNSITALVVDEKGENPEGIVLAFAITIDVFRDEVKMPNKLIILVIDSASILSAKGRWRGDVNISG